MIYFVGDSFAPTHLRAAAVKRGLPMAERLEDADLVFISQDTPTDENGNRDTDYIRYLIGQTQAQVKRDAILVLTSQVEPGFCRSLNLPIFHMAETLRVTQDAEERAYAPEQIILGVPDAVSTPPKRLWEYCKAFECPIRMVSWETAEASKIAINIRLTHMVNSTNELAEYCKRVGASWEAVAEILRCDKRIGPHSYLTPGNPLVSKHLLRDWRTFKETMYETTR